MAFVRVDDLTKADTLWEAGLLWWDAYGRVQPTNTSSGKYNPEDYYRPTSYALKGAVRVVNYYILLEE